VLSQVLAEQSHKKTLTISLAEFETLNRLRHLRPPQVGSDEYGAKVLGYSVLGNGNLRLCLPGGLGTH